jgi:PEGA domain
MSLASSSIDRAEAPLFADGLGERVVAADATTGELLQILRLRATLTAVPSFEFALRERTARLVNFRHAYYARVRRIDRVQGNGSLAVVSDHVEGTRLSEILRVAHARGLQLDTNAALCLIRQLVPAIALLHENARDASHGLIAPERIIVTPHARLVIVEHVAGSAIEQLQFGRERLWQEFRIALPSSAGMARFDHRADVNGIGVTALSLVLGRPLAADEFPHAIPSLLMQARERSPYGEERPLSNAFRNWLARTLQLDVRRAYASAPEALAALEETLASDSAYVAAPVALETFLSQYMATMLDPLPVSPALAMVTAPGPVLRAVESSPPPMSLDLPMPGPRPVEPPPARPAAAEWPQPFAPAPAEADAPARLFDGPSSRQQQTERPATHHQQPPATGRPPAMNHQPPATSQQPIERPATSHRTRSLHELPTLADLIAVSDLRRSVEKPGSVDPPAKVTESLRASEPAQKGWAPARDVSPTFDDLDDVLASSGDAMSAAESDAVVSVDPPAAAAVSKPTPARGGFRKWIAAAVVAAVVVIGGALFAWKFYSGSVPAAPELGTLVVQSSPAGVEVFVDGVSRGMTPARVSLPAGSHILELRGRGVPRVIPFQVPAGGQVSQYLEFADTPMTGMLVVHSQPDGAKVTVDGMPRGVAPLTLEGLSPGDHEVVLQNDNGTSKHIVKVLAGTTASLVAPVIAAPAEGPVSGWVSITAPFTVEIREGGQLIGTTESDRLMMAAGRHVLEFVNQTLGYRETRVVNVSPGKVASLSIDLPKGKVNLNATPWAEVWIDGKRVGETPIGNLEVPIGPHEVVFRHPQLGEKKHAISVTAGGPVRLSVAMK